MTTHIVSMKAYIIAVGIVQSVDAFVGDEGIPLFSLSRFSRHGRMWYGRMNVM